jgi:hypothetical protein
MIIDQRHAELAREAAAARMARRTPGRDFSGLRIRVGSLIIVVGRTFPDDRPTPHLARF